MTYSVFNTEDTEIIEFEFHTEILIKKHYEHFTFWQLD